MADKHKQKTGFLIPGWLAILQLILVRYVKVAPEWVDRVRAAAARGPVCFVLRNRSLIDFLCLRGLCRRHGLPEVSFVAGLSPFVYMPFLGWLIHLFRRRSEGALSERLSDALSRGGSAVVFLRRPAVRGAKGSRPAATDGVHLTVLAQARLGTRVQALPTVFLWGESPMKRMPGTMDFILGSNEYPRLLRSIWLLLRRRSVHELQVGPAFDLAHIRAERGIYGRALTGVVRAGMGRHIEVIRRAKLGSLTKPSARVIAEVTKSRRLNRQLRAIARDENMTEADIPHRTKQIMAKLAADIRPRIISLFAALMMFVWKRLYTGIDIRHEDVEQLRRAVGEGAVLLLPTHKSHVDYLVVSHIMREHNLMLPHIAAGQNLSFWPLGWLFRSSGAFFIRRRFIHDRFYTAVVTAYVRRLVQERYAIEVFIEGGRSRTGKLLRPRTGMLDMALKALTVNPGAVITVVPIYIGYEHVIEEKAYVAESEGVPKKSESIKGLLKTSQVLFHKYGRLYVRVHGTFSVDALLREKSMTRNDLNVDSTRRALALEIGIRTLSSINDVTVVTPSSILSTVLLVQPAPQVSHSELTHAARWLTALMRAAGATLSPLVEKWAGSEEGERDYLEGSIAAFLKTGRLVSYAHRGEQQYQIRDGQRLALDYYKNNSIHVLVPSALVATSLRACTKETMPIGELRQQVRMGCALYQWEFTIRDCLLAEADAYDDAVAKLVDRGLDTLTKMGIVEALSDRVRVLARNKVIFLSDVLRNFHEVYLAALETVHRRYADALSEPTATMVQALTDDGLSEGRFIKPEGHSTLNQKSAMSRLKELRLTRPAAGEAPYGEGALGTRLLEYLRAAVE